MSAVVEFRLAEKMDEDSIVIIKEVEDFQMVELDAEANAIIKEEGDHSDEEMKEDDQNGSKEPLSPVHSSFKKEDLSGPSESKPEEKDGKPIIVDSENVTESEKKSGRNSCLPLWLLMVWVLLAAYFTIYMDNFYQSVFHTAMSIILYVWEYYMDKLSVTDTKL